jgi:hypothetical protein
VAAVVTALVVGTLVGLALRPLIDAYLSFKTAEMYRDDAARVDRTQRDKSRELR